MKKLSVEFYLQDDVLKIAKEILGKILVTNIASKKTSGRIVEVEAYNGIIDKASHAFNNKRTNRTEIMYADGGVAYVYLCYGIHHLFNIVTNRKDIPHAILIRAVQPVTGIHEMLKRSGKEINDLAVTKGPGNLSRALGIHYSQTGMKLTGNTIYIIDDGVVYGDSEIACSPRIGVDYAGKDSLMPYRFYKKGNPYVSGKKNNYFL